MADVSEENEQNNASSTEHEKQCSEKWSHQFSVRRTWTPTDQALVCSDNYTPVPAKRNGPHVYKHFGQRKTTRAAKNVPFHSWDHSPKLCCKFNAETFQLFFFLLHLPATDASDLPSIQVRHGLWIHCSFTSRFLLSPHVQHACKRKPHKWILQPESARITNKLAQSLVLSVLHALLNLPLTCCSVSWGEGGVAAKRTNYVCCSCSTPELMGIL